MIPFVISHSWTGAIEDTSPQTTRSWTVLALESTKIRGSFSSNSQSDGLICHKLMEQLFQYDWWKYFYPHLKLSISPSVHLKWHILPISNFSEIPLVCMVQCPIPGYSKSVRLRTGNDETWRRGFWFLQVVLRTWWFYDTWRFTEVIKSY